MIHKLMPSRNQAKENIKVIADLDDLIAQPIGFKVLGKVYEIKPVDTETFLKVVNVLGEIQNLLTERSQGKRTTDEEVYRLYYDFIRPLCPGISLDDLKKLAIPQLHGLINLIVKHLSGTTGKDMAKVSEAEIEDEKKNSKMSR